MKCPNCGKEIKDKAKFCGYCGREISLPVEKPKADAQGNGNKKSKTSQNMDEEKTTKGKNRRALTIGLIIALVLAIACAVVFLVLPRVGWPKDTEPLIRDALTDIAGINDGSAESLNSIILDKLELEETSRVGKSGNLELTVLIRNSDVATALDEIAESSDTMTQDEFISSFKEKFGSSDLYEESVTVTISKDESGEYQVQLDEGTYDLFMGKILSYYRDHLVEQ